MIVSFKHKGLKRFFETGSVSKIQPKHEVKLSLILALLNAAKEIKDVDFPGSGLHPLKGNLQNHWSVTVNGNWRITFKFENGDAYILDYIDYH
jgi:proteic killer suppression protein|tara:strand:- start:132 stop:410 length:279 start_codon:yes stop_codon:yes gene_type:complete